MTSLITLATPANPSEAQLLETLNTVNTNMMYHDVQAQISTAANLANSVMQLQAGIPDPTFVTAAADNNTISDGLSGVGRFAPTYVAPSFYSPTTATPPGDLIVSAVTMPTIAVAPTYTQNSVGFVWNESMWNLSLLNAVQAKLLTDLANGGYGIDPTDEAALWNRTRERETQNGEQGIQDAARQAAARGFGMPPGAMFQQMQQARRDAQEKNSSVSRDIALKRADMYVENRRFTIEKAIAAQEALVEYVNAYYGRQLDAMKANLEAYHISVEIYDAQVKAFLAQLSAQETGVRLQVEVIDAQVKSYTAKLSAYETLLRTEIEKATLSVEEFKAQVQQVEVDTSAMYKAQHLQVLAAGERLQNNQQSLQNGFEYNKTKIAAMEAASKLYLEPTSALAGITNAFISASSSLTAKVE